MDYIVYGLNIQAFVGLYPIDLLIHHTGNSAKKNIFQLWGGTLHTPSNEYENRILVNMNNGLNVRFQLKKTTLDDAGYYYCEYIQQGVANTFSQLKELVMWAKPSAPAVTGQDFYISKEVR